MSQYRAQVRQGETLLNALYREGRYLEAACGGHGRCRSCRVKGADGAWRLACEISEPGEYEVIPAHPIALDPVCLPDTPPSGRPLGLAVDLGTTTVAAALTDRGEEAVLASASRPNPQVAYGEDVLSRAGSGRDPEHRARLAMLARHAVRSLLARVLEEAGASAADVGAAAFAGNASMTMLLLSRDPEPLCRPPYEPGLAAEGFVAVPPGAIGLEEGADCFFLPALGGHVGSDTTAAMLAAGLLEGERPGLLVDLGTNGEVVLATADAVLAASSAAGPAFEGGGVSKGSPARPGAIERVDLVEGRFELSTIGGRPPRSWCGSGVLEIVAALRDSGHVDASGRLHREVELAVPFTQADIREVQLAKGAVVAAAEILCREGGIASSDLVRVVLTGAFGSRLRNGPARRIGLVPSNVPVELLRDGALAGAVAALAEGGRERAHQIAQTVRHVPLAARKDFEKTFVKALALRHDKG